MAPGRTSVEPLSPPPAPPPADSAPKPHPPPIDAQPPVPTAPVSRAASLAPPVDSEADADADADSEADAAEPSTTINLETFHQIVDLDEDDTHDFSRGMAWAYFSQASTTFTEMDEAYSKKDLKALADLGHYLKGSSAALGVAKVQASCEQIQHAGERRGQDEGTPLTDSAALQMIGPLLTRVKAEYAVAETWLKKWYEEHGGLDDEDDG